MTDAAPQRVVLRRDDTMLEVLTAGAAVRRLAVAGRGGTWTDLVLGHADPTAYVSDGGYLGAVIGRFANRLDGGRFTLDGAVHEVTPNEGTNALHGGVQGFDQREWTVDEVGDEHVRLSLVSGDGDQGFPGELAVSVTYVVRPGKVDIGYTAETSRPTIVNLTNHAYVNLDGEGSGPVDDHVLQVFADAFTPTRADLIPTGEIRPVESTAFDLRAPRRIDDVLAEEDEQLEHGGGLDHNFVLRDGGSRLAARVTGGSGRVLEVWTDRPGLQVYTGAHFDGSTTGLSGRTYGQRAGLALEAQGFPDAPNHPGFPSTALRPGERFTSTTTWVLRES